MMTETVALAMIDFEYFRTFWSFVFAAGGLLAFFRIVRNITKETKTQVARQTFADLYVVGMIRKFAKDDGIELDDELKAIRKMEKLEKASNRSIDRTIEVELNEKISALNQKKIDEINKDSKETKKA